MISEDVNVIFAYLDAQHKFHRKTMMFVKTNKRRKNIFLANVLKNFLVTYQGYITDVATIIEFSVNRIREEREKSPIKNPSPSYITRLIEAEIEQGLKELSQSVNYAYEALKKFKELLLTEFSLPELFFEEDTIAEFRERFITKADDLSLGAFNTFFTEFPNKKLMKQHEYKKYNEKLKLLKNMKDYEDRRICAELFCFGEERGAITFLTFDKAFNNFIKTHGKDYRVKAY